MRDSMWANAEKPINGLLILVDALRFDVLQNPEAARILAPNISALAERGQLHKVTANAQSTSFVVPALVSQSYPLDFGGYNTGVRNRPRTYTEAVRDAGFRTAIVTNCGQLAGALGYERGFDTVHAAIDHRKIVEYRVDKVISYELDRYKKGELSKEEIIAYTQQELGQDFETLVEQFDTRSKASWNKGLKRKNSRIASALKREQKLLAESPELVIEKLTGISTALYWQALGKSKINPLSKLGWRIVEALSWRLRNLIKSSPFPFFPLGHYQVTIDEMMPTFLEELSPTDGPKLVHTHIMDVHDCRSWSRPFKLLRRMKWIGRWRVLRKKGLPRRAFWYDIAVSEVDHHIGRMLKAMSSNGMADNTIVAVVADHGYGSAKYARPASNEFGFRTHAEDLEIPMIIAGPGITPTGWNTLAEDRSMLDSMGICATFLEALAIPKESVFKGKSIWNGGTDAVISENAGRGNADLARRDLYFTVSTPTERGMFKLVGSDLSVEAFYDLVADPQELENRAGDREAVATRVEGLIDVLFRERAELLKMRGAVRRQESQMAVCGSVA